MLDNQKTIGILVASVASQYSVKQRFFSLSVSLAMAGGSSVTSSLAHAGAPLFGPVSPVPAGHTHSGPGHGIGMQWNGANRSSPDGISASSRESGNHRGLPAIFGGMPVRGSKSLTAALASQLTGVDDLNLTSGAPLFAANSLAGFKTMTLDIGGKQEQFSINSKLTGAELVAAQQVLGGGRQSLSISSDGVASGGHFVLNSITVAALDHALGGTLDSLVIGRGIRVDDTLSSFNLTGSLINSGAIIVGAAGGAGTGAASSISAANIYNGPDGVISSAAGHAANSQGPSLSLNSTGAFVNNGAIFSSGALNINAPSISNNASAGEKGAHNQPLLSAVGNVNLSTPVLNNSGLITSRYGNINIDGGGGDGNISVDSHGGTLQAAKGNINFNQVGNTNVSDITLSGGNYLSRQVNLYAGAGDIEADLEQVTGTINGSAGAAHVMASTANLQLGNICVSGDPTYFNQNGDITISGALTGSPDLAIVASGNIIGNKGSIDTSQSTVGGAQGGSIFLAAGANITAVSGTSGAGGASATIANSGSAKAGSDSGGFIDLSGSTLSGVSANQPLTKIDSSGSSGNGGDITMIAYSGSGKNSGSIVATATAKQAATGATTINAAGGSGQAGGNVLIVGGGKTISAQNIEAGSVTIEGAVPTITGTGILTITDGTVPGGQGSFAPSLQPGTAIAVNTVIAAGAGGVAGVNNGNGNAGGAITLIGDSVVATYLDASGGGGAGGTQAAIAGGSGGAGGTITLTAGKGNVQLLNQINVSGGGGGGGAGGHPLGVPGAGGSGGNGGAVTITASASFIGPTIKNPAFSAILAYDGGGGGNGGLSPGKSNVSGGGGGGGGAFGGGGGGGSANTGSSGSAAGGGGGGGSAGGGGGGGGTGPVVGLTGGNGGSSLSQLSIASSTGGAGGLGVDNGSAGVGSITYTGIGGDGGAAAAVSGSGGHGAYAGGGSGGTGSSGGSGGGGGSPFTNGGSGSVTLNVGKTSGSISKPLYIDTANLSVSGAGASGGIFVQTKSDVINVQSATMGSAWTLSVSIPNGSIIETGPVVFSGATTAKGILDLTAGTGITLTGDVTGISTLNMSTASGDITGVGNISATNVSAIASTGNVALNLDIAAGKTTNLAAITVGAADQVTVLTTGAGTVIDAKALVASDVVIGGSAAIGTATKPFLTNALAQLKVVTTTASLASIKDANTGSLDLDGVGIVGGSFSLISAAKNLEVDNLNFGNVTIQDTFAKVGQGATVTLAQGAGNQVGDGFGTVTIISAAAPVSTDPAGAGIFASNLILKSTASDFGSLATPLMVASPSLTVGASKGSVFVTDSQALSLNAGTALNNYNVSASGLTVVGAIGGASISLADTSVAPGNLVLLANVGTAASQTVLISSELGMVQGPGKLVSGHVVTLKAILNGDIGVGFPNSAPIFTQAGTSLSLQGAAATHIFVNQKGNVSLSDSSGAGLTLTSSGSVSVTGTVNPAALTITSTALAVSGAGKISTAVLDIISPTISITSSSPSPVVVSGSAIFASPAALTISGKVNSISMLVGASLSLGGVTALGKNTTNIFLGDAKTGANNPLEADFDGTLLGLNVTATGTFSVNLTGQATPGAIALDNAGNGGSLSIKASNFIALGNTSFAPIQLIASGAAGQNNGSVTLNLTGTQAVTLSGAPGSAKTGAPFQLEVSGGGGSTGTISASDGGALTVDTAGIAIGLSGATLNLSGGKSLLVKVPVTDNSYNEISLTSGSKSPFLVDASAAVGSNGTDGVIGGATIFVNASGPIQTNTAGSIVSTTALTFSNPTGVLALTGTSNSITTAQQVHLTAKSGIVLGDAKSGVNNPLPNIGNNTLTLLQIDAGTGSFSGSYPFLELNAAGAGGVLQLRASSIITPGNSSQNAFILSANALNTATTAGTVNVNFTGTEAVTIDSAAATGKSPAPYLVEATGQTGTGSVTLAATGTLTINSGGLVISSGLKSLSLSGGKALAVNDKTLLNATNLGTLSLTSNATTPFSLGTSGSTALNGNGTVGDITVNTAVLVNETAGITLLQGSTVTTPLAVTFETKSLINNGNVVGGGTATLTLSDITGKSGIVVSTGSGAQFSGYANLVVSEHGTVNLGSLTEDLAAVLNSVNIVTTGSLTLGGIAPGIATNGFGLITINAASILPGTATLPVLFSATSGNINSAIITTLAPMVIGASKGNLEFTGLAPASTFMELQATNGNITVNQNIAFSTGFLSGRSIIVNNTITGNAVGFAAFSGSISTPSAGIIAVNTLTIGQSAAGKTINVSSGAINLGGASFGGPISINDSASGAIQLQSFVPVASLNFTSTAGSTSTTVLDLSTTAGSATFNINGTNSSIATGASTVITTVGGGLSFVIANPGNLIDLGENSSIFTTSGSVTLQNNNDNTGLITIESGVTIHASGTAKGVGQVNIVIDGVPAHPFAGTVPSPSPILIASGGAAITFSADNSVAGSITTVGSNVLNAAGRNIVFFGAGNPGAITLNGNDTIVADPPVASVASLVAASSNAGAGHFASSRANDTSTIQGAGLQSLDPGLKSAGTGYDSQISLSNISCAENTASLMPYAGGKVQAININHGGQANTIDAEEPLCRESGLYPLSGLVSVIHHSPVSAKRSSETGHSQRILEEGVMLMAPDQDTSVSTKCGAIKVASHAVALLVAFDGGLAVYNFHDTKYGAVTIELPGQTVAVGPGRNAVVTTRSGGSFEEVNPAPFAGYRRLSARSRSDGTQIFQSEFDLPSMFSSMRPLQRLVNAARPHERKTARALLKTAAILASLGDSTPYSRRTGLPANKAR